MRPQPRRASVVNGFTGKTVAATAVNLHLADTSGITYSPFLAW